MLKSAVLSFFGLAAIAIAGVALYLAAGGTFHGPSGDGGEGAVAEEVSVLRVQERSVTDPDPEDLYCRGARYSTKGVAMEVVKLIGDDRCFPTSQLGEPTIDDSCDQGYFTGDIRSIDGGVLEDKNEKCGTITVQDIRMRAVIYIDAEQHANFEKDPAQPEPIDEEVGS